MGYIEDMRNLVGNQPLILIGSHAIIVNENNEIFADSAPTLTAGVLLAAPWNITKR